MPAQPADVAHPALGEPVGGDRRAVRRRTRPARRPGGVVSKMPVGALLGALEGEARRARRRPGSRRRSSRSSRGRRGCRAPRAPSRRPGGRAGCWRAPHTIVARQRLDDLVGERAAQGAGRVDVERARRPAPRSTVTTRDPRVLLAHPRSTAAAFTSVTTTLAPSSIRWRTRCRPTLPTPATPTVRPASVGSPQAASAAARMPWNTPYAVSTERVAGAAVGDGAAGDVVALAGDVVHVLGEGADVAGGVVAAVRATARSGRRRAAAPRTSAVAGSPMMTALPPPRSSPASAFL